MEGRSNVMQITVADPDQDRAVTIARTVAGTFPKFAPKPPGNQPPAVTAGLLTPARALDQPLQPRPTRALAVGMLVGLLAAAIVVVLLWRPWTVRRPAPYWT
jgi:capsular polysaccharide biosynthesis protein